MSSQADVAIVFDSDEEREKFFSSLKNPTAPELKNMRFDLQSNAADDDLFSFLSYDETDIKPAEKVEKKSEPAPAYFEDEVESKPQVESKPVAKIESKPAPKVEPKQQKESDDPFLIFSGDEPEKSEPIPEQKIESKPAPKTESDAFFMFSGDEQEESEPIPEQKVETKIETKTESKVETKLEEKVESRPAPKVETPVEKKVEQPIQKKSEEGLFVFAEESKESATEQPKLKSATEQPSFLNEDIPIEAKETDSFFFYPALDQTPPPEKKSFIGTLIAGGNVRIRSLVMPRELQNRSNGHGTIRARCCYALDKLKKDYDYIIFCEPNVVITRNVNLHALCDEFFEQKNLWGNETTGTDFRVEWIKTSCAKWFSSTLNWQKVLSPLYLWFNQPQIFRTSDLDEFFKVTEVLDNITALAWTDFLHYIYMYYLILYHGFEIRDIGLKSVVGVGEANRIANLENKSKDFKPMICKKTVANDLDSDNLFMVFG